MTENDDPLDDARSAATVAATTAARLVETIARETGARTAEAARQGERRAADHLAQGHAQRATTGRGHDGPEASAEPMTSSSLAPWASDRGAVLADPVRVRVSDLVRARDEAAPVQAVRAAPLTSEQVQLDLAKAWAKAEAPERLEAYEDRMSRAEDRFDRRHADNGLVMQWQRATGGVEASTSTASYDSQEARSGRSESMQRAGVPDEAREARVTSDLLNGNDPSTAAAEGTRQAARGSRKAKTPQREAARGR